MEISHARYLRSHGKKASGGDGTWLFTHKAMGNARQSDTFTAPYGKFSDAKKHAAQWAKQKGHSRVYVMEKADQKNSYEKAQDHMNKASKALETSDMQAHHQHLSNHYEEMGKWHESKGRGDMAQTAYDKAEGHHEQSLKPHHAKTLKK